MTTGAAEAPLRVALVSTLRTSVPPVRTGSVELLVGLMAEELHRRGHEVTVFATGDSRVPGRLLSVLPAGYHDDATVWDWRLAEFMQMGLAFEHASEFDVIHSHSYIYALPFSRLVGTPVVHTLHISPTPDFVRFCRQHPDDSYVLISRAQQRTFEDVPVAGVVHNGIDIDAFAFGATPAGYLAFIGDIRPDKRPLDAIRVAREAGVPIHLAGPESQYFADAVKPLVDGRSVVWRGELDHAAKVELLSGAVATIFFPAFGESCPLVVLESMACGTPVLSIDAGPVPELVAQDIGGVWVEEMPQMAAALERAAALDRRAVRAYAVERFSVARMVDEYVAIYRRALA